MSYSDNMLRTLAQDGEAKAPPKSRPYRLRKKPSRIKQDGRLIALTLRALR